MRGIQIERSTMIIDVIPLLQYKNENGGDCIINFISDNINGLEKIILHVGKNLTISMVERSSTFIRKIATVFYSFPDNTISSCHLINTPRTFKTIFAMLRPLLSKHALSIIKFDKERVCTNKIGTSHMIIQ